MADELDPVLTLRSARPGDGQVICDLTHELAAYEGLSHEVAATPAAVEQWLFAERPRTFCELAEWDGAIAGFAAWYYSYSTFEAAHGVFLEDVFVREPFQRRGVATALVRRLAERCREEGLPRLEWRLLAWNDPAVAFFAALGVASVDTWRFGRVSRGDITRLAKDGSARLGRGA